MEVGLRLHLMRLLLALTYLGTWGGGRLYQRRFGVVKEFQFIHLDAWIS